MATGILGVVGPGATMTYIAQVDAKLMVTGAFTGNSGNVQINGVAVLYVTNLLNGSVSHFVGAGQAVSITNPMGNVNVLVSVLEGA